MLSAASDAHFAAPQNVKSLNLSKLLKHKKRMTRKQSHANRSTHLKRKTKKATKGTQLSNR